MDITDLKLLKFAKLSLFMDEEYRITRSSIAWDLGFNASVIMIEMMTKCSKASIIDEELKRMLGV